MASFSNLKIESKQKYSPQTPRKTAKKSSKHKDRKKTATSLSFLSPKLK